MPGQCAGMAACSVPAARFKRCARFGEWSDKATHLPGILKRCDLFAIDQGINQNRELFAGSGLTACLTGSIERYVRWNLEAVLSAQNKVSSHS